MRGVGHRVWPVVRWWLPERWAFAGEVPGGGREVDKKLLRVRRAGGSLDVVVSDEPPAADSAT